jgi:hypothetical protein
VGLWLLVLRRLEFLSDRVLALLAILGPGICIDSWRLVLVEGISGLRQGEQSRAHPGALNLVNVFGVWIKMDLRGGDAAQYWLARGHRLLRPAPSTYVYSSLCHGLLVAEPIMSAFEAILRNPCRRRAPGRTAATHPRDQSCKAGRVVGQACRRKQSSQQLPESQIGQERLVLEWEMEIPTLVVCEPIGWWPSSCSVLFPPFPSAHEARVLFFRLGIDGFEASVL